MMVNYIDLTRYNIPGLYKVCTERMFSEQQKKCVCPSILSIISCNTDLVLANLVRLVDCYYLHLDKTLHYSRSVSNSTSEEFVTFENVCYI